MADVFIAAVAKYRGVTTSKVLKDFGACGVKIGAAAVRAGMADEVGQLEATLLGMQRSRSTLAAAHAAAASSTTIAATVVPAASVPPSSSDRIRELVTSEAGRAMPALSSLLAFDTAMPAPEAHGILDAARKQIASLAAAGAERRRLADDFIAMRLAAGAVVTDANGVTHVSGKPVPSADQGGSWKRAIEAANAGVGAIL